MWAAEDGAGIPEVWSTACFSISTRCRGGSYRPVSATTCDDMGMHTEKVSTERQFALSAQGRIISLDLYRSECAAVRNSAKIAKQGFEKRGALLTLWLTHCVAARLPSFDSSAITSEFESDLPQINAHLPELSHRLSSSSNPAQIPFTPRELEIVLSRNMIGRITDKFSISLAWNRRKTFRRR